VQDFADYIPKPHHLPAIAGPRRDAGRLDLADFMSFLVEPDTEHPEIRNEGIQYEGLRFRVECVRTPNAGAERGISYRTETSVARDSLLRRR